MTLVIVLRNTARITLIGIALGLGAAAAVSRSLEVLLFGVKALDVVTFASVTVILFITAFVACIAPLIRAARVDPLVALRYE